MNVAKFNVGRTNFRLRDRFHEHLSNIRVGKSTNVGRHFNDNHDGDVALVHVQVVERVKLICLYYYVKDHFFLFCFFIYVLVLPLALILNGMFPIILIRLYDLVMLVCPP